MSDYRADRIEKPTYFRLAPLVRGRGKRHTAVIGFDSEADTRTGEPMLLQFSRPGGTEDDVDLFTVPKDRRDEALHIFLRYVERVCTRKDTEYLIYGWNLAYEFTQLFGFPWIADNAPTLDDFTFDVKVDGIIWTVHVLNDKRHLFTLIREGSKRMIRMLDGMMFYKTGLDRAAKMLGLGAKYEHDSVDRATSTRADLDNPEFLRYARVDAFITRKVGEQIVSMHEEFDVTTTISAPHFASKVFRHRFLDGEIEQPLPDLEQAGLWSYHGGKNGFYLDEPALIPDAWQYDITSAYPEAMRQLPDPVRSEWSAVGDYQPGRHAIYRATFTYRSCEYRGFLDHYGHWPTPGYIEDIYLTSYELDAMVARDEVTIRAIRGWQMEGPSGGALSGYVDHFFGLKSRATGPERETAKLFLNSLYGKFFQKVALGDVGSIDIETDSWIVTNPDELYDWRAGGLYHPPIASLITGFVRAKMHGIEHRTGALMTSTDGCFGTVPPDPAEVGTGLGDLTVSRGALSIWRERLYVFDPADGGAPKAALHGYMGRVDDLRAIPLAHGTYRYTARQMVTLKQSRTEHDHVRYTPGRFIEVPRIITI
jgi:hypothetical protein